jgi:hypothetical protein
MTRTELVPQITHYVPVADPERHPSTRRAVCGVVTVTGGSQRVPPEAAGSSRVEFVSCCECLDVIEALRRIEEVGCV